MTEQMPAAAQRPRATVAFVASGRPPTSNKSVGKKGGQAMAQYNRLYKAAGGALSNELTYATVYYFVPGYKPSNDADAGNVNKRVLDGLQGVAYDDDHVVRLVTSGVIDYGVSASGPLRVEQLDLTHVPAHALPDLATAIAQGTDHFLYVEVGPLRPAMMVFGIGEQK